MSIRVAINGYGRIGRNILRAHYESSAGQQHTGKDRIEIVAINDVGQFEALAHLTQYDSVHGRFRETVSLQGDRLFIGDQSIRLLAQRDPATLPWREMGVDVVFECTGLFTSRKLAAAHLEAGAEKVIISAPSADVDATIVFGVNHSQLNRDHQVISNASCTTNCLAPVAWVLNDAIGIERGNMTTIHAYTNDQFLTDESCADLYRARAATQSLIPTKTGAASAVGMVLPELDGKLSGMAIRVPTINVSLIDFHFIAPRTTSVEEVNQCVIRASKNALRGVLAINALPLVSVDFNHNPASCVFDIAQTQVNENLVKVMAWYDNEWGFSNRMLDTAMALMIA